MARYRLVHLGTAALLSAAVVTTIGVAQSALATPYTSDASSWVPIVPCRLMDTRAGTQVGERDTPLGAGETATVAVVGEHGNCVIPETATGITGNLTATNPTATSFLTAFPSNADLPNTSTLNWRANSQPVANHIAISLSPDAITLRTESLPTGVPGSIKLYNHAGTVNVILDITGYFEPSMGGEPGPQGEPGEDGVGDLGCEVGQTITWNGEAWSCADPVVDTLAALECTINQSIRWNGEAWECRNEPIVATLSRPGEWSFGYSVSENFQSYSPNVDTTSNCTYSHCELKIIDVVDHTSCQVTFSGNRWSSDLWVETTTEAVIIHYLANIYYSDPLYTNITCNY